MSTVASPQLHLLQNSCKRLPQLVESDSPSVIIANELRILFSLGMECLQDALSRETHKRMEELREKRDHLARGESDGRLC